MSEKPSNEAEPSSLVRTWSPACVGYAACVWAIAFALMSFYWALGGTAGLDSASPAARQLLTAGGSGAAAVIWITGVLKLAGGVLALALVQPWGEKVPRWLLLIPGLGGAVLLAVHGGDFLIRGLLWQSGLLAVPETVDSTVIAGYTFLWGPWWVLGGLLFGVAAWDYRRRT